MNKLLVFLLLLPSILVQAADVPQEITFAAYNVENYIRMDRSIPGEGKLENAPKPEKEIKALIGIIASVKPDILGICEMGQPDQFADFQARLKAAGLDYPYSEYVEAMDENRHLALVSRFPIVATNSQKNLSFELNGTKQYFKRGILDVTIEVTPGYRLHLLGTHLKSKRDVPEDQAILRRNEAHLLHEHVKEILAKSPDENLLVYGDLNDTPNEATIREIIGSKKAPDYLFPIDLRDQNGEKWTHYWKTADLYSRIDYILASRGVRPEIVAAKCRIHRPPNWEEGSDHSPLVVVLQPVDKKN